MGPLDWNDWARDKMFVGRTMELARMDEVLLGQASRPLHIYGPPGAGKTALAEMFAHQRRASFPAGTYRIHASRQEPLCATVDRNISHPQQSHLLILDEIDLRLPPERIDGEIQLISIERPQARIVTLGRKQRLIPSSLYASELYVGGLNQDDIHEMFRIRGLSGDQLIEMGLFDRLAGNPHLIRQALEAIASGVFQAAELLRLFDVSHSPGILDAAGRPIQKGSVGERLIISDTSTVNIELLRLMHNDPERIHELTPRQFEEFVAEVLHRLGYDVTLTPATKDGGKDIYAAKKDHLGSFLYLVECKKYARDNHVGVGIIRQLNGVVHAERATAGILATTSFFTREAIEFQKQVSHTLSLRDYLGLQGWLRDVFRR